MPANTALADKVQRDIKPGGQVLTRIEVVFPPGCAALARSQLFQGGFQVHPANPGGYAASDGEPVTADLRYDMEQNAGGWYWYVWNLDDTYPHELTLRLTTFEKWQLWIRLDPVSIADLFRGFFARFKKK
uniref:Uncharacterized protein n=1 Tax=viral metagenome TaxID=1070528 RepID=A0A6H2A2S2_9ZZZZ